MSFEISTECSSWQVFFCGLEFVTYEFTLPSNSHRPRIIAAQSEALSNRPRIVAAASKRDMHTRVRIISDDGHHASQAIHVVRAVSMADSRTERLHILLTASSNHHRLTHMYFKFIKLSLMSVGFPNTALESSCTKREE